LVLQARDEAIIEAVHSYGLLTGEQIHRLIGFGCVPRRNVRLRALFDHRYLDRKFLPTLQGSARPVYLLGPQSVDVVARRLGADPLQVRRRMKAVREMKEMFLTHRLQVNDIRLAFASALGYHSEAGLDRWESAPDLREVGLMPDAFCEYRYRGHLWNCFLELDRSTESHRGFRAKVESYLDFGLSGGFRRRFGCRYFRVLIVALTEAREGNLRGLIEGITEKMFWLTVLQNITRETIFGRIWRRPRRDGLFVLHDS
jgi:hypothetical protein